VKVGHESNIDSEMKNKFCDIYVLSSQIFYRSTKSLPAFRAKYFSHLIEIEIKACHVQLMSKLVDTLQFSYFPQDGEKRILGYVLAAERKEIGLEEAKVLAREQLIGNYHSAGSCMVAPSEKEWVVDERLKLESACC
jgi:hypothetical protein